MNKTYQIVNNKKSNLFMNNKNEIIMVWFLIKVLYCRITINNNMQNTETVLVHDNIKADVVVYDNTEAAVIYDNNDIETAAVCDNKENIIYNNNESSSIIMNENKFENAQIELPTFEWKIKLKIIIGTIGNKIKNILPDRRLRKTQEIIKNINHDTLVKFMFPMPIYEGNDMITNVFNLNELCTWSSKKHYRVNNINFAINSNVIIFEYYHQYTNKMYKIKIVQVLFIFKNLNLVLTYFLYVIYNLI